jgi:phospholipid/cholesterol/gamma-HCH transport system substrate-binding protein
VRARVIKTIAKLILFGAICTGFTLYLAFTIGNIKLFEDRYPLVATFDDVNGLLVNDNVKIAGVPVGKVTGISIVEGRARVKMSVRDSIKLPSDTRASIRWRNLLGQRYVYLEPGTASTTMTSDSEIENTLPVIDLGELFNKLGPIIQKIEPSQVNLFLDNIVAALDGNEAAVRAAIADLGTVMEAIGSRDEAIGRIVENLDVVMGAINSRDVQIRTVLDNLLLVAQTFNENTDVLDSAVTELGTFAHEFGGLLADNRADLDRTISNVTEIVRAVRTKLPVLEGAVDRLDDAFRVIYNSARHGEWLNQTIPCGRVITVDVDVCIADADAIGLLSAPARQTRGSAAIRELLLSAVPR